MKLRKICMGAVLLLSLAACGNNNNDALYEETNLEDFVFQTEFIDHYSPSWNVASTFWGHFIDMEFETAFEMMSEHMQTALGGYETLGGIYNSIVMSAGDFTESSAHIEIVASEEDADMLDIIAFHTTAISIYRLVVAPSGEIEGFWLVDTEFLAMAREGATYSAEPIVLGAGSYWPLDGLLTVPEGASAENPVPAVVLVHGSGSTAGDMDSSIFNNRPFFDIADYLSSNGIAVIRYHKRTFSHAAQLMQQYSNNLTVWQETVEDAVFAADFLRNDPRIDNDKIFMLGLSMGGMLAPRIHTSGGDFAGMIIAGATPQRFTDLIIEQSLASVEAIADEEIREGAMAQIAEMAELFDSLQNMTAEEAQAIPFDGGATFYYLRDFNAYPFEELVQDIDVPFLVLHGTRDFQTPAHISVPAFREAIGYRANVTIIVYDDLNHMLMPSVATSMAGIFEDYARDGNVSPLVLEDIVTWINLFGGQN